MAAGPPGRPPPDGRPGGALFAALTLYLYTLGWTAPEIGGTLSAAPLAGAVLTLIVGPLSDHRGRYGGRLRPGRQRQ